MSSYKSLVLTPATDEELKLYIDSLYELYKNIETGEIEIVLPNNINDIVEEKAYFINLNNLEIELEKIINERPIYMIETKEKTVEEYTIINGLDIPLENILNKNCKKLKKC